MANLDRLKAISARMPGAGSKEATRAQEAQAIQFQQGLASAPANVPVQQASQQVGAALTQAQGQAAASTAAKQGQQNVQLGQAALQEQKFQGSKELQKLEREQGLALGNAARQQALAGQEADIIARKQVTTAETEQAKRLQAMGIDQDNRLQTLTLKQREDLSKLGRDVKAELFDKQMMFERDQNGRKFSNERQLMDYAVAKAQTDIKFADKLREMQQDADKDIIMLEAINNKLNQALSQKFLKGQQKLDQESKLRIKKMIEDNEKKLREKKRKAAQRGMIVKGLFTVGGAVAGGFAGNPMAGAAAGGAAGDLAVGAMES